MALGINLGLFQRLASGVDISTSSAAADLVTGWSSSGDGLAMVFESEPSIYVSDSGTPANDKDLTLATDGLDTFSNFLTYTSPSVKNVMQSDGYIKYAAHNLCTYSENFSDASWGKLRVNVTADAATDPNGGTTADEYEHITSTTGGYLSQTITVTGGATYVVSAYVKNVDADWIRFREKLVDGTNNDTWFNISSGSVGTSDASHTGSITDAGNGWYLCSIRFTASASTSDGIFFAIADGDGATTAVVGESLYIWGAHVYTYPADTTYLATTSAARYALPIQYDTIGDAEGLLVEPAATNLVASFLPSSMGGPDATKAFDQPGAPDGTSTAIKITATSGAAEHTAQYASAFAAITSVVDHCCSVYVKADTATYALVEIAGTAPDLFGEYAINLTTGTVAQTFTAGSGGVTIEDAGNSWWRVSIVDASDGDAGSPSIYVGPHDGGATRSWTAVGTEAIYCWGFQAEQGSVPTSLIKTFGATATRAGDDIWADDPYTVTNVHVAGAMYCKGAALSGSLSSAAGVGIQGTVDGVNYKQNFRNTQALLSGVGDSYIPTNMGWTDGGNRTKLAVAWESQNFAAYYDGTRDTSDDAVGNSLETYAGTGTNADVLFAVDGVASLAPHMLIKEFAYYPERLRNEYLEAITAGTTVTLWTGSESEYWVQNETDALSLDFLDDHWQSTTGYYGSAYVLDSGTPLNDYDSTPDGLLTYTSPSIKTVMGPSGTLQYAPHNLITYSEQFDHASWVINDVAVTADNTTDPDGGSTADKIDCTTTSNTASNLTNTALTGQVGQTYAISCYLKEGTHRYVELRTLHISPSEVFATAVFDIGAANSTATETDVGTTGGTIISTSQESVGDGWYKCTLVANLGATYAVEYCVVGFAAAATGNTFTASGAILNTWAATEDFYAWGFHVYAYPADTQYVATTTAAAYGLPYDWYTSGAQRGLLVEPAATNQETDSQDFTQWTNVSTFETVTMDQTGPDGVANSAALLADDNGGGTQSNMGIQSSLYTVSTTTDYVFSIYAKASGLDYMAILTQNYTTPGSVASYFNLSTGAVVSSGAGHTSAIEDAGNGWYRCSITFTTDVADTAGAIRIYLSENGTTISSIARDGTSSIMLYGAQHELGTVPTSLIKTYGSTATRAVDDITLAATDFPMGDLTVAPAAHTHYWEFVLKAALTSQSAGGLTGSSSGRSFFQAATGPTFRLNVTGSPSATITNVGTLSANVVQRAVGAFTEDNAVAALDGAIDASPDTDADVLAANPTEYTFGDAANSTTIYGLHLRRVIYLPRRVTDAHATSWSDTGDLP